jgi:hypothetical protein
MCKTEENYWGGIKIDDLRTEKMLDLNPDGENGQTNNSDELASDVELSTQSNDRCM